MLKFIRKIAGITLFEVLLVLLVASLIAVAAIKYAKHQTELAAAQLYGLNLYTYGQGVYTYVYDNSLSLATNGTLPGTGAGGINTAVPAPVSAAALWTAALKAQYPNTYSQYDKAIVISSASNPGTGGKSDPVTWATKAYASTDPQSGGSYLPDNISFKTGMAPLVVAVPQSATAPNPSKMDNNALTTTIFYSSTNTTLPPLLSVSAGALFEQSTKGGTTTYTLMPALTTDAIKHANTLYTSYQGAAAVTYDFPYLSSSGTVTPTATPSGTLAPMAATNQPYLRVDGGNMMQGDIRFDINATQTVTSHVSITDVNQIRFARWNDTVSGNTFMSQLNALDQIHFSGTGSKIDTLTELDFDGTPNSLVQNLVTLNFQSSYPGNDTAQSSISGLNMLNFQISQKPGFIYGPGITGLASLAFINPLPNGVGWRRSISNLDQILWADGTRFTGFNPVAPSCSVTNTTTMKRCTIGVAGDNNKMFCALGSITMHDNVSNGSDKYCKVYVVGTQWVIDVKAGTGSETLTCVASCFYYDQ